MKKFLLTFKSKPSAAPTESGLSGEARAQSGFTLVETLVAIFILALAIAALLTLTAGGYFSIRYSKNDIVATNLLQESLEYIHNYRDTSAQIPGAQWIPWVQNIEAACGQGKCMVNPYATGAEKAIETCPRDHCRLLNYYSDVGLYGYHGDDFGSTILDANALTTSFNRWVTLREINNTTDPELLVTATITWNNGTSKKSDQQSIILTKWNMQ